MRVFIYEYSCAPLAGAIVPPSIRCEGRAMLTAVAADFAQLPNVEVCSLPEVPLDGQQADFKRLAAAADWSVIIAPEFDGILLGLCRLVQAVGGRLLGPSPAIVALAGDKWATYRHLEEHGLPTPQTWLAADRSALREAQFPLVQKPALGAGSFGISLVRRWEDIELKSGFVLQEFVRGTAVSVAVMAGAGRMKTLPPVYQHLSADGRFQYVGGRFPLPPALATRAAQLAEAAIRSLPSPCGYLGIDLVLGNLADGDGDFIIEINPRFTTSYVGLRFAARENLADFLLRVAAGESRTELHWRQEEVAFTADGRVELTIPPTGFEPVT